MVGKTLHWCLQPIQLETLRGCPDGAANADGGNHDIDSGATNPLDRLAKIFEATGDEQIISWLCQKADGFYCPNPKADEDATKNLFAHTQKLVSEFSDLLQIVSATYSEDGEICSEDTKRIRREWEDLKSAGESFLKACEDGNFGKQ